MSTGLVGAVKTAALDAMDNAKLCDLRYGTVVSVSPLKVKVTNQFILPQSLLIVPQHLTNYKIECTISTPSESNSYETEKSVELKDEGDPISEHTHKLTITTSGGESRQSITVHNALRVGDKVVLLRKQGGQSYLILDRI